MYSFLRSPGNPVLHLTGTEHLIPRRISGGILHTKSLRRLKEKKSIYYPFAFIIYNTKPVGHQVIKWLPSSTLPHLVVENPVCLLERISDSFCIIAGSSWSGCLYITPGRFYHSVAYLTSDVLTVACELLLSFICPSSWCVVSVSIWNQCFV